MTEQNRNENAAPNDDSWDLDNAELKRPVSRPRAVVSVSFARDEFEKVEAMAKSQGQRVSTYIRETALGIQRGSETTAASITSGTFYGNVNLTTPHRPSLTMKTSVPSGLDNYSPHD